MKQFLCNKYKKGFKNFVNYKANLGGDEGLFTYYVMEKKFLIR